MGATVERERGKILVIANPAAGNGKGTSMGREVVRELEGLISTGKCGEIFSHAEVDAAFLSSPEQTQLIIESAQDARAIITVGGDGLVHLAVNGLMKLPQERRPAFTVVPAGTGNDYARALGLPLNIKKVVQKIVYAQPHHVDVGLCNGEYYAETLSFGVDAAIALETMERRIKTGRNDANIYFSSGIDQIKNNLIARAYHGSIDGKPIEGKSFTFAVQIGPYYGGGFKICPDAKLDDGLLDICISHPPLGFFGALYVFARAKFGKHVGMKLFEFLRAHQLTLEFDEEPPCQIDGEPMHATHFDILCVHNAIQVLA